MTLTKEDGTVLTESEFTSEATENAQPSNYTVPENVYETFLLPGSEVDGRRLKYRSGQIISKAQYDALFADPTITGIDPATGEEAGGTVVTITGTLLSTTTSVTFGGVEGTDITATDTEVTVTTPAGTAGAVDVVLTAQGGTVTETGGFTYEAA